jgi:hypothetical protein
VAHGVGDVQTRGREHANMVNAVAVRVRVIRNVDRVSESEPVEVVERMRVGRPVACNRHCVASGRPSRDRPPGGAEGELRGREDACLQVEARDRDPRRWSCLSCSPYRPRLWLHGCSRGIRGGGGFWCGRGAAISQEDRARTHHEGRDEYERDSSHQRVNGAGCGCRVGFGPALASAGLTCTFGGVATIFGGDDSDDPSPGVVFAGVVSNGVVSVGVVELVVVSVGVVELVVVP